MQIVTGALVMGVLMFAAIAVIAVGAMDEGPAGRIVSMIAAGMAGIAFVAHLIVPGIVARQAVRHVNVDDTEDLYVVYRTKLIIGLALLEGAAFFCIVTYIIEQQWWTLGIAGGLALWMLIAFPSRHRVEQWIETQRMIGR